jgi:hypothetical protein
MLRRFATFRKECIAMILLLFSTNVAAELLEPASPAIDPLKEYRQCGAPARLANGEIRRRADVLAAYKRLHPCPVTGLATGACPGFAINHVIPLAKGGCDAVSNLQWVPNSIKSCAGRHCIDRWERLYYGNPHGIVVLP